MTNIGDRNENDNRIAQRLEFLNISAVAPCNLRMLNEAHNYVDDLDESRQNHLVFISSIIFKGGSMIVRRNRNGISDAMRKYGGNCHICLLPMPAFCTSLFVKAHQLLLLLLSPPPLLNVVIRCVIRCLGSWFYLQFSSGTSFVIHVCYTCKLPNDIILLPAIGLLYVIVLQAYAH